MKELIEKKNALLKQSYTYLQRIDEIGRICENADFSKTREATLFIHLVGENLRRLTFGRYEMLLESSTALPEAEQGAEYGN